jgi:hypothetical protein
VVGAGGAQLGEAEELLAGEEVEDLSAVVEVTDHPVISGRDGSEMRRERRGLGSSLRRRERPARFDDSPEGCRHTVGIDVRLSTCDDPPRVRLRVVTRRAPRGDAVPAEDDAHRVGVGRLHRGDVEPELEAGPTPRHPDHPVAVDLRSELLAVERRGDGDASIRVEVIDVRGGDECVHRGVDRRSRSTPPVETEVEGRDHLVFAVLTRVDVDQGPEAIESQHRQTRLRERAEVAARTLHPQQLHVVTRGGVGLDSLGRGVAAGIVRVAPVGTQPIRAGEQLLDDQVHGASGEDIT